MNRFSIGDILLKNINSLYILLDKQLFIKAAYGIDLDVSSHQTLKIETFFLNYFNEKYHERFTSAFALLGDEKENGCVVKAPIELNNESLNISWNICSVWNNEGWLTGFELLGVTSEFPKENDTRQAAKYSESLFDYYLQPYFSLDLKGNIIRINHAFANLIDYAEEELLHTSFVALVDGRKVQAIQTHISNAINGIPQEYTCILLNKGGKQVVVNIINTPLIESGNLAGVNAFVKESVVKPHEEKTENKDERRLKLIIGKLKKILDSSLDMICAINEEGIFTNVSAACKDVLGYKPKELIGKKYIDFVFEDDIHSTESTTINIKNGIETTNFENRFYKKDGSLAFLVWSSKWEAADKRFYCIARDATQKKESEAALKASEEKYRILFYNHPIPTWIYDVETLLFLEVNEAAIKHYGYSREEFLSMPIRNILFDKEVERFDNYAGVKGFYNQNHKGLWVHKKKSNEVFFAEITSNGINFHGHKAKLVLSIDRTEQTMAEQELRKSNERYHFLSEATFDGIWDWNIKTNEIQWNEGARKMFEIADSSVSLTLEWWRNSLHHEDKERVDNKLSDHLKHGIAKWEEEYRFKTINNKYKYIYNRGYILYDENNQPLRMIGAMQDLTERKAHEDMLQELNHSLEKRANELAESNAELERFAYVASHDLQEPLRMVTSFLQLLEKRYKDKLDNKAHEYIDYAVDGAERMKRLILDLLEYSRVNSSKAEVEDVDVNEIVEDLKILYKNILIETKGTINAKELPTIKANKTQILQLFQNIISNAFKYKSEAEPVIDISYEEEELFYKFWIADNGIGIDPKFFHKIFIIFQRLHNREEYSGTGIGLAICKKIIDKHGGKIWVTSTPGAGSTFYFTFPKSK